MTIPFPARNTRASMPVERLALGTRVTVDLAPQLGLVLPGVIYGRRLMGENRYDVDLGLDGIRLCNVPEGRIKLDEGSAA